MEHLSSTNTVKLILGDCLEELKNVPDKSVRLIIADPPYNTSKAGGRYGFKGKRFIDNEWDVIEDYEEFSKRWMSMCRKKLIDNGTMYVWGYHRSIPLMPIKEWYQLNLIVWHKKNAFPTTMQNSIWSPSCEFAYFLRKRPGKDHVFHIGKGDFHRDIFFTNVVTNKRHPAEKPLDIITEFVRRSSNEGDTVLDPFMGSGTTGVASKRLNRAFIGIENNKEYFDVAKDRIASNTYNLSLEIF